MPVLKKALAIGLTILVVGGVAVGQGCDTPECVLKAWFQEPPFEFWQIQFNPYTMGLPIGAQAPALPGVDFSEGEAVVWVVNQRYKPEYLPLVREWGGIPGLQVVVVASGISPSASKELQAELGETVKLVLDPQARVIAAQYQVGEFPSPVTFLVNRSGTIVWRRRSFQLFEGPEHDRIVRYFAEHGSPPDDALPQYILWYGDPVPWPEFPLYTLSGEEYWLRPGKPILILSAWPGDVAYTELEGLPAQFPQVEFLWLFTEFTEDALKAGWEYGRRIGLDRVHPEIFAVPLEEYLARAGEGNRALVSAYLEEHPTDWKVVFDRDLRLIRFWNFIGTPAVMIIDAAGRVAFPCTFYPVNKLTGEPVPHPRAKEEIIRLLSEAVGR